MRFQATHSRSCPLEGYLPGSESELLPTVHLVSALTLDHVLGPWKVMLKD